MSWILQWDALRLVHVDVWPRITGSHLRADVIDSHAAYENAKRFRRR